MKKFIRFVDWLRLRDDGIRYVRENRISIDIRKSEFDSNYYFYLKHNN